MRPTIRPEQLVKSGPGRYAVLLAGLGAAGVALGWRLGPETAPKPRELARAVIHRR
ncbi:hypothetical protein GCM10009678_08230 [Actinomadura kijaniata]|uniref:Uncharacterized protein n=1 Tax=Actinomadura namibiensis TaxID=182080 RepID=A0A7W3LVW7_ACTNM|nr:MULTISPECIES: hypothetical protein [Actinomadura]MBA8955280.1 hypothetical protein [Actinomadura namibiensis]